MSDCALFVGSGTHLENFLESVADLPRDVCRNLALMRELDARVQHDLRLAAQHSSAFAGSDAAAAEQPPAEQDATERAAVAETKMRLARARCLTEEKLSLAYQAYDAVDRHIRALDALMRRYESELAGRGDDSTAAATTATATATATTTASKRSNSSSSSSSSAKKRGTAADDAAPTPGASSAASPAADSAGGPPAKRARRRTGGGDDSSDEDWAAPTPAHGRKSRGAGSTGSSAGTSAGDGGAARRGARGGRRAHGAGAHHGDAESDADSDFEDSPGDEGARRSTRGGRGGRGRGRGGRRATGARAAAVARDDDADEDDGDDAEGAGRAERGRLFELNMPVDPNEPRYCICHEVSHGQMVCCDNPACPIAWFHFGCVGLTQAPPANSKWYCPMCRAAMAKKR